MKLSPTSLAFGCRFNKKLTFGDLGGDFSQSIGVMTSNGTAGNSKLTVLSIMRAPGCVDLMVSLHVVVYTIQQSI